MISSWSSTLWEEFPVNNSNNHAWSAGPLYHLGASFLGIRPLKPAYAEYAFLPLIGDLKQLSGVVPSPQGSITASCSIDNTTSAFTQEIISPPNTLCIVGIPKQVFDSSAASIIVKVGTDIIWQNGSVSGSVAGVEFYEEDAQYIKFKVQPGSWVFTSVANSQANAVISPKKQAIRVFPNFTNGLVNVQFADNNKNASVKIIDLAGHTVYNKKLSVKQGDIKQADLSAYSNGAYVIVVNSSFRQKIIKTDISSN